MSAVENYRLMSRPVKQDSDEIRLAGRLSETSFAT